MAFSFFGEEISKVRIAYLLRSRSAKLTPSSAELGKVFRARGIRRQTTA